MHDWWAKERARFSHDWLQNEFMQAIGSRINKCKGSVGSVGSIDSEMLFVDIDSEIIHKWRNRTEYDYIGEPTIEWLEACNKKETPPPKWLLDTCEKIMSPRTMFESEPLSNLDKEDKQFLSAIAHDHWLERHSVLKHIHDAQSALIAANEAVTDLDKNMRTLRESNDLSTCSDKLTNIQSACDKLIISFSKLPKSMMV
jgi:hypothetical protein